MAYLSCFLFSIFQIICEHILLCSTIESLVDELFCSTMESRSFYILWFFVVFFFLSSEGSCDKQNLTFVVTEYEVYETGVSQNTEIT